VASELVEVDDRLARHGELAAGAIVVRVTGPEDRWLVWVRPETARTIRWGGDPYAKVAAASASGPTRLGPRASFEEYVEIVRGKSLRWTDQEVEAARLVARRLSDQYAGRALREAEIAATLQRTLMLERFPDVPGIDGAGHYVPSRREPIGGDWYDVFFRPQRHPTLVLGDVAGHGVEAAATMAQLRHALRAYILRAPSIAVAVSRLNDLIMQAMPKEMATSIVAELDPGLRRITMVNAGHLPPLVIDDDGAHLVESERGLALGIRTAESYRANSITLPPGAAFVVYSDGLIESRTRTIDEALDLLVREASACSGHDTAEEIADRLVDRVGSQSDTGDDLTVVVVRFVQPDDGDHGVEVGTPGS
jgi:serine phosphatase RsbU (regulator of sigma subunit)